MDRALLVYHPNEAAAYVDQLRLPAPSIRVIACGTEPEAARAIADAEILFAWGFPRHLLTQTKHLRWIHAMGAGVEGLLGPELDARVLVTRTGGVFGKWMAEYTVGWCAWVTQGMEAQRQAQRLRAWRKVLPAPLHGKILTIVGFGDIGATIARAAMSLGMQIRGVSRRGRRPFLGAPVYAIDQLDQAVALADFVVITLPLTPDTRGLIGERELGFMKASAWLLHIGRGPVLDEEALVQAVVDRRIAGAILDVFCAEPLPPDSRLWDLENVVVTPHVAGISVPAEITPVFNDNLLRYLRGQQLRHLVDRARGY